MADPVSKFGGVPVPDEPKSKFGGMPDTGAPAPADPSDPHGPAWNSNTFLGTLGSVLASPVKGLIDAPGQIIDWAKRGFHNPPSGGFAGEEPVTQMLGNAVGAATPPIGGKVGDVARGGAEQVAEL